MSNRLTRDPTIVIHGNSLIYSLYTIWSFENQYKSSYFISAVIYRSQHVSYRHAQAAMHIGIAKPVVGKTYPAHTKPAILRIW